MTTVSFLILEKRSQSIEKHRFKKHIFSKVENGFFIFYREYANGVIDNEMRLTESYIEFIQSLSKEVSYPIYFLIKNILHKGPIDSLSIGSYLSASNKKYSKIK